MANTLDDSGAFLLTWLSPELCRHFFWLVNKHFLALSPPKHKASLIHVVDMVYWDIMFHDCALEEIKMLVDCSPV